jgi:hypothetical protein
MPAELLAVMALSYIRLYLDENVARGCQSEISWDFAFLGQVMRNRGRLLFWVPSDSDRRVVDICLTLIISKPRSISPSDMSCAWVTIGRLRITDLISFRDF